MASPPWHAAVSNEARTALVKQLWTEVMRREGNPVAVDARERAWVAATNVELALWLTAPDKDSYVAGVRLKAAQWSAETNASRAEHWAGDSLSPIDYSGLGAVSGPSTDGEATGFLAPMRDCDNARVDGSNPSLTLEEQTYIARHLALLDKQNLEIVALYQRHFNEIQRLVGAQTSSSMAPQHREFQMQELQREQEGARLQLQRVHELQQQQLREQPTDGHWGPLVRAPIVDASDPMPSWTPPLEVTAGVAALGDESTASPSDLTLSTLEISPHGRVRIDLEANSAGLGDDIWLGSFGTEDDSLTEEALLAFTPPMAIEGGSLTGSSSSSEQSGSALAGNSRAAASQATSLLPDPVVIDWTSNTDNPEEEPGRALDDTRRAAVNEALRLYYTSRVTDLRLEYKDDLTALCRELRQMPRGTSGDPQAQKINALIVDIMKILVVLTQPARDSASVAELEHVEDYIQRRVRPMLQRLKVKQAIFGDQRSVPTSAARTAQRQWQRYLRRMRDQQQQSPSSALPVNVSPPRSLRV